MQNYKLPYPDKMRRQLLPQEFERLKSRINAKLETEAFSVSIILDIWSSRSMMGFVGFNVAGVTKTFDRFVFLLAMKKFEGRHTGEAILAEFDDLLKKWNIPRKAVSHVKL